MLPIVVTIYLTRFVSFWKRTFQAEKKPEALLPVIIEIFSMRFFGSCEQVLHGEICRLTMGTGKIPRRFCRWRDSGVWERLLEILISEPDFEWLMIDASHIKVHPHAAGAHGGNQDMGRTKGGSTPRYTWPWMRMVCRSECLLQQVPLQIARRLAGLSKE